MTSLAIFRPAFVSGLATKKPSNEKVFMDRSTVFLLKREGSEEEQKYFAWHTAYIDPGTLVRTVKAGEIKHKDKVVINAAFVVARMKAVKASS